MVANTAAVVNKIGNGQAAIIADLGTVTTISAINRNREYVGCCILPGVGISLNALAEQTALLPRIEILPPRNVIATNTVDSLFNLLPALVVLTANILALITQLIQHASLQALGFGDSLTDRVKAFRMSLISCVVFLVAYLVAVLESSAVSTLTGTVAQNIYIILLPGLALEAVVNLSTGLVKKGPRKLGCLFYVILLIPCLFLVAPLALAVVEVIVRLFSAITSAIKPPEDPDDPF
jgi:hypothetical protein